MSFDEASIECGTTRCMISSEQKEGPSRGLERDVARGGTLLVVGRHVGVFFPQSTASDGDDDSRF